MKRARLIAGAAVAALLAGFSFTACVNESPEINYQVEYTHKSDFTEVLNAINSQTTTIADKIAAVEAAIKNGTATLEEASKALKEAIVKSLDNQTTTLADKIAGVTSAVNSQALTLKDKLEILDKTIADGVLTLEEASKAMKEALVAELKDQTKTLDEKLSDVKTAIDDLCEALYTAITEQTVSLEDGLEAVATAVDDQTIVIRRQLKLIRAALEDTTQSDAIISALGDIKTAVEGLDSKEALEEIAESIADLTSAVENLDIDNTGIIEAIDALELTVTVTGGGSSDPSNPGGNTDTPDNPDTLEDGVWYKLDDYTVYANVNTSISTTNTVLGTKIESFSNPKMVGPGETIEGLDSDFPYIRWTAGTKDVTQGFPDMNDKILNTAAVGRVAQSVVLYKRVTINGIVFCRKYAATCNVTPVVADSYYVSGANYGLSTTTYLATDGAFLMNVEDENSIHFIVRPRN